MSLTKQSCQCVVHCTRGLTIVMRSAFDRQQVTTTSCVRADGVHVVKIRLPLIELAVQKHDRSIAARLQVLGQHRVHPAIPAHASFDFRVHLAEPNCRRTTKRMTADTEFVEIEVFFQLRNASLSTTGVSVILRGRDNRTGFQRIEDELHILAPPVELLVAHLLRGVGILITHRRCAVSVLWGNDLVCSVSTCNSAILIHHLPRSLPQTLRSPIVLRA